MAKEKKNKLWSFIFENVLNILLVIVSIVIVIGLYYIVQIKVLKKDYGDIFGYTFFEVATGSMYPTMGVGDVVIVKLAEEVSENDIIVYKDGENFVTHRLIKKDGNKLTAKGDANNSEDKPVEIDNVLGKVIKIIPEFGIIRRILLSPEIVGLVVALVIVFYIPFVLTSKSEERDGR